VTSLYLQAPLSNSYSKQASSSITIAELEYFHYAVYILEKLSTLVRHLIGDHGISHRQFVNEPVAQEETKILLYLGIAHIGAIHDLRLASAIFTHLEHVRYYLNIRPTPIHYAIPLFVTFTLLLLYYLNGRLCQDPHHRVV